MATTVKQILASAYVLLDNASEEDLDLAVAVEQFGLVLDMMKFEEILADSNKRILKGSVDFTDTTGIVVNSLTNYGEVVMLRFNDVQTEECSINQLEMLEESGRQGVAFWVDATDEAKYIELAMPQTGTLDVWYEPDTVHPLCHSSNLEIADVLRSAVVARLAWHLSRYVHFKDPVKRENMKFLAPALAQDAQYWKNIYLEKVSKIGTGLPFQRLPFMAR